MEKIMTLADRALPEICQRPANLFEIPSVILSDTDCIRATISRLLGIGIVAFAGLIKLPQILTIMSNKSVVGLSVTTFLVETFGYTYNLAAHYKQGYPITTYGDFYLLLAQNYFILLLFYQYTSGIKKGYAVVASFIAGLMLLCSSMFPTEVIELMTLGNVAVVILGRTPQIYANFVNGSTGALSPYTSWGIFLGACARIFTTLQDVDSFNILAGYLSSALLNGIIAFQVLYYRLYPSKKKTDVTGKEKKAA